MELAKYKACICEGSAEEAIIDILVDNDLLIFNREEMLEERATNVPPFPWATLACMRRPACSTARTGCAITAGIRKARNSHCPSSSA